MRARWRGGEIAQQQGDVFGYGRWVHNALETGGRYAGSLFRGIGIMFTLDEPAPMSCFLSPIPELDRVAEVIVFGGGSAAKWQSRIGAERVEEADVPVVFAYAARIMGREDPAFQSRRVVDSLSLIELKA